MKLQGEVASGSALPAATAGPVRSAVIGMILAIDAVGHCLALATICFAGGLAAGLGLATVALLLATALMTLALMLRSGFPRVLGIAQDTSIAILAPAVALAAAGATGSVEAKVATAMAVMGASAFLSGLCFWVVGRLGLGRMVRLFPYPVAAGFLASSGALLVLAAVRILTGSEGYADLWDRLATQGALLNLAPAIAMAACLVVSLKWFAGSTPVLVVIAVFLVGFYAVLAMQGVDRDAAVALGLLPDLGEAGQGIGLRPDLFRLIDWTQVVLAAPTLAAVVMICLIGVLLNTSGVELATRQDVDVNRELRLTGLTNMVIGGFGGLTSYLQGGATVMVHKLEAQGRPMALAHIVVILAACVFAPQIVAAVPTFIAAGLLMFIGVAMLDDWLIAARRQLMPADYALVLGIVLLTLVFGILPAIAAGVGLAVLSFAIGYARLPVIREVSDAASRPSVVDRVAQEAELLARDGTRIRILHLQGALFFGSVDQMIVEIGELAAPEARLQAVILDFGGVDSVDSAACAGLGKLGFLFGSRGVSLHLAQVSPEFEAIFRRWGLPVARDMTAPATEFRIWPTVDDALQQCEDALLTEALGANRVRKVFDLLNDLGGGDPRVPALLARLETLDLAQGDRLIKAGTLSGDVFVLEEGRLGVYLANGSGLPLRLRLMAPGAIVGEVAHLLDLPRTADVIAETPARVWRMSAEELHKLTVEDPGLFALWSTVLARALALKVAQTNRLLSQRGRKRG